MSCGRPAYVYDAFGGDGWVTADTYDAIEADALAGQAFPDVIDARPAAQGPRGVRPGDGARQPHA